MAKYLVQHRRGTAAQWAEASNEIPKEGEIVIEIDEVNSLHKLKIGDGVHTYADLAYLQTGDEIVTQVINRVKPRVVSVELTTSWNQNAEGKYSQVIALENITKYSRLDLQPSVDMLAEFKQLGLVFVTENNDGVITVYSVGNMPSQSYTMQATIIETECDGESELIIGTPVGIPVARPDWNQSDETKSDYIKNKPRHLMREATASIVNGVLNLIQICAYKTSIDNGILTLKSDGTMDIYISDGILIITQKGDDYIASVTDKMIAIL